MSATAEAIQPKTTTIAALKVPTESIAQMPAVLVGFGSLQSFELMQRGAKLLSSSTLVPKDYQGNLPNCVIALNMAQRLGADPLMVMQNLYVVHGRPAWSAQFLIASFNQCGRFAAIRYKWGGKEGTDDWSCQAYALEKATNETISGPVITIGLAKKEGWYSKSGSKWQTIPQLMLMYRAAAWLVRTHAPEISMGLHTEEEMRDVYDASRGNDGRFEVTTESLKRANQDPGGDYVPFYSIETAIAAIKEAGSPADLETAWGSIIDDFSKSNRQIPDEIEHARTMQKESLAKL